MGLLDNLQSVLGMGGAPTGGAGASGVDLKSLLGPAVLGGLMGAVMSNKSARKFGGQALLVGGGLALGGVLWSKYKDRLKAFGQESAAPAVPAASAPSALAGNAPAASSVSERAARLLRAAIFAAKSDGHVDEAEQKAIEAQLAALHLGADAEGLVREAMAMNIDPAVAAAGVKNEDEALEVYLVSLAVIEPDQFMEKSYLDALARELKIPPDVQQELAAKRAAAL